MEKSVPVLEDLPSVEGKNVLVRTDFNVPMAGGRITDDLAGDQGRWTTFSPATASTSGCAVAQLGLLGDQP